MLPRQIGLITSTLLLLFTSSTFTIAQSRSRSATPVQQAAANVETASTPAVSPSPGTTPSSPAPTTSPESKGPITPEMLTAIGSLWTLALIVFGCILVIVLRRPLRTLLENIVEKSSRAESVNLNAGFLGVAFKEAVEAKVEEKTNVVADKAKADGQKETMTKEETAITKVIAESAPEKDTPLRETSLLEDLIDAVNERNTSEAEEIYKKLQESETDTEGKLENESFYLYLQGSHGNRSAVTELQKLTQREDAAGYAHRSLALIYEDANEFDKAVTEYRLAIQKTEDEEKITDYTIKAASCLFMQGKQEEAYTTLLDQIKNATTSDLTAQLYSSLASLYQKTGNPELRAFALEKSFEHDPTNTTTQFSLAFAYSEVPLNALSLIHYKSHLRFVPDDPGSLNNSGVAFARMDMPIHATRLYKKAATLNNTLAAANLANLYKNAGFADEAMEILTNAKQQKDAHPNVSTALADLAKKEDAEKNAEVRVTNSAFQQQRFLRDYAHQYFIPESTNHTFAGVWMFPDAVEVTIKQADTKIEGEWVRAGKKSKIEGEVKIQTAKVTVHNMTYYSGNKELGYSKDSNGYAFISEDGQKVEIMTLKNNEHSFITLRRKLVQEMPDG